MEIADAQKVKGLAPLAQTTDRLEVLRCSATATGRMAARPSVREERSSPLRGLVSTVGLKAGSIDADQFRSRARSPTCSGSRAALLKRLQVPSLARNITASIELIDDLEQMRDQRRLKEGHAEHPEPA